MSELFAEDKEELPEEWHDTFDQLTAQGKSPTGIKATIEYVTTEKTQSEVSGEYNVSEVTLRNLQTAVVALGPIEEKRGSTRAAGNHSAMDLCNYLSDSLGWEEGKHYSVNNGGYQNETPQPALLKEGWQSLFNELLEEDDG